MSAKIVGTFLRAALGPIQFAASLVTSNKVKQGLDELAAEPLLSALERGVSDVAKLAGVPRSDIEVSLPMAEFLAASARLAESQPKAIAAWNLHAGPTGFMDIITALTVDGRKPEIGRCLERVAKKVSADKALAEPLLTLAGDVNAWEELIARAVAVLEEGGWLARALLRKRLRVAATAAIPALVIAVCAIIAFRLKAGRDRVEAALAVTDACKAAIDPGDLRYASRDQTAKLEEKRRACAEAQAAEERRREEERAKREREAKIAAEKQAHLDACDRVAGSIESGTFPNVDAGGVVPADASPLLERMAKRSLAPADIGPNDVVLPCADTPAHAKLEAAFGAALRGSPTAWTHDGDPSPMTANALEAEKASLQPGWVIALTTTAESQAKIGLSTGRADTLARAKRLCALAHRLSSTGFKYCEAVSRI